MYTYIFHNCLQIVVSTKNIYPQIIYMLVIHIDHDNIWCVKCNRSIANFLYLLASLEATLKWNFLRKFSE